MPLRLAEGQPIFNGGSSHKTVDKTSSPTDVSICKGAVELVRMAVRADFRGQGLSSLLVLAVARFALSLDCDWVVLTTGMVKKIIYHRLRASSDLEGARVHAT